MKKIMILSALLIVSLATPVWAAPKADFALPAEALEIAPGLYNLGSKYDSKIDAFVEGYAIVHKKVSAKGGSAKAPRGRTCSAVLASGAKWKSVEPWEVFAGAGLTDTFVLDRLTHSINTWESAAVNNNILGAGSLSVGSASDPYTLDNRNQVSFGNLDNGTIAVTVVWGVFSGPIPNRVLVEWDQVYNTEYGWSESGEAGKMDFWNIAIHELGHSMGLADIYNTGCAEVTMYGYGDFGETKKQTLESADISGINLLY